MVLDASLGVSPDASTSFTWLVIGLGAVVATVAADRSLALFRTRADADRLRAALGHALGQGDLVAARMCVVRSSSFEARVVAAGFAALPRGAAAIEARMRSESQLSRLALERHLGLFGLMACSAPLVGFLGTALGCLRLVVTKECTDVPALTTDVVTAVRAILIGGAVAIAATMFSFHFKQQISLRVARADALGSYVLSFLKDERRELLAKAAKEASWTS